MKILVVQPKHNIELTYSESPSTALLILGTLAKQEGHDVLVKHYDIDHTDVRDDIAVFKPDIIGITCNTFQVKDAQFIIKQAEAKGIKIVIGGVHAPYLYNPKGHTVVTGEGENKWLEIIGSDKRITSLDDIPISDFSLIDFDKFCGINPVGAPPSAAIMASRGCSYNCSFCDTPVVWGRKVRRRSPANVLDEVLRLHVDYGINEVFFQDDTFNLDHKWAFEIFNGIINLGLEKEMLFKICCRVNEKLLTQEFLSLAAKAGVWNIFFGIESGSQEMLDRMNKGITITEIKRAIKVTHDTGINTQCSFIVGLPGETLQTLRETEKLIHEVNPSRYGWCFFCPFPGTEATREAEGKGHVLHKNYEEYGYGQVLCRTDALDYGEFQAFGGFG